MTRNREEKIKHTELNETNNKQRLSVSEHNKIQIIIYSKQTNKI